jgi:uncharacterized protein (DUF2147 family)
MFGLPEALMSFIRRQVGLRTDVASSAGSAHAKLSYIAGKNIVAQGSAIKSIQRGTIVLAANQTSEAATISPVITGKTMLNFLGASSRGQSETFYDKTGHQFVRISLTNSTTVTAYREYNGGEPATVSYEVIEFY